LPVKLQVPKCYEGRLVPNQDREQRAGKVGLGPNLAQGVNRAS